MKKLISILLVLALALSLAACGLSLGGKGGSPAAKTKVQKPSVIHGMMQEDGTAYVPKDDGSVIKINDDVDTAVLSPDRKTLVVLLTDGTLYYTDAEQSEKHEVADKIDWLSVVRNEGAFYIDEEDDVFCVIFESGETVKLGHDIDGIVAPDSLDSIIYDDDGGIYLYKTGEGSPEKVGRLDGDVAPLCINNDGSLACWYVSDEGKTTLYSYENDERTTIASLDDDYDSFRAVASEDQALFVLCDVDADQLFLKKPGEEAVKVRLGNELASTGIYCQKGLLTETEAAEVSCLYVLVEADKGNSLYFIDLEGERERMITGIDSMAISDGYIVYRNDEDTLYFAQLDGAELKEESRIASDVELFRVQGDYVYYFRNCEDNSGTLYCRKLSEADGEAVKIASDVGCYIGTWSKNDYLCVNESGDTVFYFRNLEEIKNSYMDMGTLYRWSWGDEEPTKIASDVVQGTVTSYLLSGVVVPDRMGFMRYDSTNDDRDVVGDLYFYDGSDTSKIASEVIY